jgi:HSP20 family molecular chaperone IbpA
MMVVAHNTRLNKEQNMNDYNATKQTLGLINDMFDILPDIMYTGSLNRMYKEHSKEYEKDILGTDDSYPTNVIQRTTKTESGTKEDRILQFALAGFNKNDISVSIRGDILDIKAEKPKTEKNAAVTDVYQKRRIAERSFKTQYTLGAKIDKNSFTAKFENGLLEIGLPVQEDKIINVSVN